MRRLGARKHRACERIGETSYDYCVSRRSEHGQAVCLRPDGLFDVIDYGAGAVLERRLDQFGYPEGWGRPPELLYHGFPLPRATPAEELRRFARALTTDRRRR